MDSTKKQSKKNFSVPTVGAGKNPTKTGVNDKTDGTSAKEDKQRDEKEKSKPKKFTAAPKSSKTPGKPLSDAEYKEIFDAVLEQISFSKLTDECMTEQEQEKSSGNPPKDDDKTAGCEKPEHGTKEKVDAVKQDADGDCPLEKDDKCLKVDETDNNQGKADGTQEENPEEVDVVQDEVASNASGESAASSLDALALEVDQWERPEEIQQCNERTPQVSEGEASSHSLDTVHKIKKEAVRQNRLAPRKLCFDDPGTQASKKSSKNTNTTSPVAKNAETPVKEKKKKKHFSLSSKKETPRENPGYESADEELPGELGTWVQCSQQRCKKWRYLPDIHDPMLIPELWVCSMHPDSKYNSCDKEEQEYDDSDHIFTRYTLGSLVWAKMDGYPWWPGMIDIDPDFDIYCEIPSEECMHPTAFHIVFLDEKVSRAWMRISRIRPLTQPDLREFSQYLRGHKFKKGVSAAMKRAQTALEIPVQERMDHFGFAVCAKKSGRMLMKDADMQKQSGSRKGKTALGKKSEKPSHHTSKPVVNTSDDDSASEDDSPHGTGYCPDVDPDSSSSSDSDSCITDPPTKKRQRSHQPHNAAKSKSIFGQIYSDSDDASDESVASDDSTFNNCSVKGRRPLHQSTPKKEFISSPEMKKKKKTKKVNPLAKEERKKKEKKSKFSTPSCKDSGENCVGKKEEACTGEGQKDTGEKKKKSSLLDSKQNEKKKVPFFTPVKKLEKSKGSIEEKSLGLELGKARQNSDSASHTEKTNKDMGIASVLQEKLAAGSVQTNCDLAENGKKTKKRKRQTETPAEKKARRKAKDGEVTTKTASESRRQDDELLVEDSSEQPLGKEEKELGADKGDCREKKKKPRKQKKNGGDSKEVNPHDAVSETSSQTVKRKTASSDKENEDPDTMSVYSEPKKKKKQKTSAPERESEKKKSKPKGPRFVAPSAQKPVTPSEETASSIKPVSTASEEDYPPKGAVEKEDSMRGGEDKVQEANEEKEKAAGKREDGALPADKQCEEKREKKKSEDKKTVEKKTSKEKKKKSLKLEKRCQELAQKCQETKKNEDDDMSLSLKLSRPPDSEGKTKVLSSESDCREKKRKTSISESRDKETQPENLTSFCLPSKDHQVPDGGISDDMLDLNEEVAVPNLNQIETDVKDMEPSEQDTDDSILIDLDEEIPIPSLQQVMNVKGKGDSDGEGLDSDPLELAED